MASNYQTSALATKDFRANNKAVSVVVPPGSVFPASLAAGGPIREDGRGILSSPRVQPQQNAVSKVTAVYVPGQFEGPSNAKDRVSFPEQMAASLADLGRDDLKQRIKDFRGRFKLDFSDDYLDALSLDRLRHLLLAALLNAKAEP
jgi:hypothetical protein